MLFEADGHLHWLPEAAEIQTLVFNKEHFSKPEAKKWAREHGFKSEPDETGSSYRFRQKSPKRYKLFRSKVFKPGLTAVFGIK